jgi:hypothetical protein
MSHADETAVRYISGDRCFFSVQQGIKLTAGVEGITIAWKGRRGRS